MWHKLHDKDGAAIGRLDDATEPLLVPGGAIIFWFGLVSQQGLFILDVFIGYCILSCLLLSAAGCYYLLISGVIISFWLLLL